MSDGNNRNDNLQDYLNLLEEYGNKETQLPQDSENNENLSNNEVNNQTEADENDSLSDADFFKDYDDSDEEAVYGTSYKEESFFGGDEVNISSHEEKEKNIFKRIANWYNNLPKKKKIAVSIVAIVLAVIIVLSATLGIFIGSKFNKMGDNIDDFSDENVYDGSELGDISGEIGSADFNQALRDWASTGNDRHMASKDVINVLLIGADSRKGTNSGNTDVMMIVSVNKKTKQLKLVSFLRDSYLFVEGKKSSYCTKLNAAYSMGGPECLIQTIENNYKINIDNYVMVNFKSFEAIIDAMGGITVDVKKYEADYNYRKFKVTLPYGENVKLNGEQALCFVRIRGCDSDGDVSRTRRQRQVINAMIDRVKTSSISDLNKYVDVLMPYVDTGYSQTQIISLGIKALTGGWAGYDRTQIQMPPEDCRTSGSANGWVWVIDYQKAANILQTELYGSSNIVLEEDRITIIDVYRGVDYSSKPSSSSSSSSNSNSSYSNKTQANNNTNSTTSAKQTSVAQNNQQSYNKKPAESTTAADTTQSVTEPVNTQDTTIADERVEITEQEKTTTATTEATQPATTTTTSAPPPQYTPETDE